MVNTLGEAPPRDDVDLLALNKEMRGTTLGFHIHRSALYICYSNLRRL